MSGIGRRSWVTARECTGALSAPDSSCGRRPLGPATPPEPAEDEESNQSDDRNHHQDACPAITTTKVHMTVSSVLKCLRIKQPIDAAPSANHHSHGCARRVVHVDRVARFESHEDVASVHQRPFGLPTHVAFSGEPRVELRVGTFRLRCHARIISQSNEAGSAEVAVRED